MSSLAAARTRRRCDWIVATCRLIDDGGCGGVGVGADDALRVAPIILMVVFAF